MSVSLTVSVSASALGVTAGRLVGGRTRSCDPGWWLGPMVRPLIAALFDPYRPEKHYMRGPGPKWRARHGDVVTPTPRAQED